MTISEHKNLLNYYPLAHGSEGFPPSLDVVFSAMPSTESSATGPPTCPQPCGLFSLPTYTLPRACAHSGGLNTHWVLNNSSSSRVNTYLPVQLDSTAVRKFHSEVPQAPQSSIYYVILVNSLSLPSETHLSLWPLVLWPSSDIIWPSLPIRTQIPGIWIKLCNTILTITDYITKL